MAGDGLAGLAQGEGRFATNRSASLIFAMCQDRTPPAIPKQGSVRKAANLWARLGGGRGDHEESRRRLAARPSRRVGAHFEAWLQARSPQIDHPRHDRVLADDHMTRLGLAIIDVDLLALGGMG